MPKPPLKRILKPFLFSFLTILLLTSIAIVFCNRKIEVDTQGLLFDDVNGIPVNKAGLLLGTSKQIKGGYQNQFFNNRIDAAVALYKAGKIKTIIISGDNATMYYNEPIDMKKALVRRGIPDSAIVLDYAGFRTFDSVVRCKEIFGQDSITIISQEFHNARAIFIARKKNIKAIGYNAKNVSKSYGLKTLTREKFARVKVFIDLYLFPAKPKFLGEKINIE